MQPGAAAERRSAGGGLGMPDGRCRLPRQQKHAAGFRLRPGRQVTGTAVPLQYNFLGQPTTRLRSRFGSLRCERCRFGATQPIWHSTVKSLVTTDGSGCSLCDCRDTLVPTSWLPYRQSVLSRRGRLRRPRFSIADHALCATGEGGGSKGEHVRTLYGEGAAGYLFRPL